MPAVRAAASAASARDRATLDGAAPLVLRDLAACEDGLEYASIPMSEAGSD